jgi:hypothetical protein
MRSKNELKKCPHCVRHNWHENTYCSWCARKLPKHLPYENLTFHIVALIAIVSMLTIAVRLWG